jgi:ketosteroid isomerase-like protein
MPADEMKAAVVDIFTALATDEIDAALSHMADDVSWFSHGMMPQGLSGQRLGKEAAGEYLEKLSRAFVNRKRDIAIQHIFREGNVVICETRVRGRLRNGGLYENDYGYVFDFLNGRVAQVREYFDSLIAAEAFAGLLW